MKVIHVGWMIYKMPFRANEKDVPVSCWEQSLAFSPVWWNYQTNPFCEV